MPAVLMACAASGSHAPRHPTRLTMRRGAGGYLATRRHTRLAMSAEPDNTAEDFKRETSRGASSPCASLCNSDRVAAMGIMQR